ncbi:MULTISPECIES: winged helix DNA-binding domain-containing protein [Streptomyces]|uniref:winged helix DNA-binding domain-containing protein n=1 Tax=Streptomyces TaxID=1883 RepID=UPI0029A1ED2C|nr:winged helix DNA-binding domain-containing protein [Streptomyces sp. WI03-4A]MDX2592954.1 winged helix DNA-binding domain-containing protein [Streptomyces sp. WI03-4A]
MLDHDSLRRRRACAQALAGGVREASAEAVLRRVCALQAQDAMAADLGIRVRGRDITASAVRTAYEQERSIVRGWYLRGTLHTVRGEDARWILRLLAPRILAATGRRYHQLGLHEDLRRRADHLLRQVLTTHGPLTRAELTGHLTGLGIPPDGQAPFHLIRHAALTGILCHGPRRAGEATYVLLDDWLPARGGGAPWDADAALAELARRYLAAHAPAGAQDFAVWSGLPISWARRAWGTLARAGVLTSDGDLTTLAGQAGERERPPETPDAAEAPDVRMLPAYDNYLLAYRTRDVCVPVAHQARVWPGGGIIRPTVVADGLAVATWARRDAGRSITVHPFEPLSPQLESAVDSEISAVSRFFTQSG